MGRLEDELERGRKEAARREKLQEPIDDETRMADIIRKISSVEHPIAKRIRECAAKYAAEAMTVKLTDEQEAEAHIHETERRIIEGPLAVDHLQQLADLQERGIGVSRATLLKAAGYEEKT